MADLGPELATGKNVPMLYDIAVSSIVTLIVLAPMAFAAWYDGRTPVQPED